MAHPKVGVGQSNELSDFCFFLSLIDFLHEEIGAPHYGFDMVAVLDHFDEILHQLKFETGEYFNSANIHDFLDELQGANLTLHRTMLIKVTDNLHSFLQHLLILLIDHQTQQILALVAQFVVGDGGEITQIGRHCLIS